MGCISTPFYYSVNTNVKFLYKILYLLYNYVTFLNERMTSTTPSMKKYTTTEYGKQNMFASEPPMQYVENYQGYWKNAEQLNGRLAMIGFFAAVHNYILFGAVIPGIF